MDKSDLNDELVLSDNTILTLEQFRSSLNASGKKFSFDRFNSDTILRLISHYVSRIDVSGSLEFIFKEVERKQSAVKEEEIERKIFLLFDGLGKLSRKYENLREALEPSHIYPLLEEYGEVVVSSRTHQKIEYFRNLVCNGFIKSETSLDEKLFYSSLLKELSRTQIDILFILYEAYFKPDLIAKRLGKSNRMENIKHIITQEIEQITGFSKETLALSIANLNGKGLIKISQAQVGRLDIWHDQAMLLLSESAIPFIEFLSIDTQDGM